MKSVDLSVLGMNKEERKKIFHRSQWDSWLRVSLLSGLPTSDSAGTASTLIAELPSYSIEQHCLLVKEELVRDSTVGKVLKWHLMFLSSTQLLVFWALPGICTEHRISSKDWVVTDMIPKHETQLNIIYYLFLRVS